ncbi:MAG: AAA family ATPase, partial [Emergencia sp.]
SSQYRSFEEQASQAQREIIEKVASEGPCVIVGRRADQILKDRTKVFRVFVTAAAESRAERISERDRLSIEGSRKKIARVDKERAAYYNQYFGGKWGDASSYDLCIDTDRLGIEGAAGIITEAVSALGKN